MGASTLWVANIGLFSNDRRLSLSLTKALKSKEKW
jgi:hypothetical protein